MPKLIIEDIQEDIIQENINKTPILIEDKDKRIFLLENKPNNLIIEGENYFVLKTLLPEYRNKVNLIYIDPPYNIGLNLLLYNDNYSRNNFKHDFWLGFMKKRLLLANELLNKESGVIL